MIWYQQKKYEIIICPGGVRTTQEVGSELTQKSNVPSYGRRSPTTSRRCVVHGSRPEVEARTTGRVLLVVLGRGYPNMDQTEKAARAVALLMMRFIDSMSTVHE